MVPRRYDASNDALDTSGLVLFSSPVTRGSMSLSCSMMLIPKTCPNRQFSHDHEVIMILEKCMRHHESRILAPILRTKVQRAGSGVRISILTRTANNTGLSSHRYGTVIPGTLKIDD